MNTLLTEEQQMARDAARAFLESECTAKLVREMEKDPLGYSPDLWRKAANLGWPGMCLPEQYGGSELPLTYLGLVLQEVGRVIAPLPLLHTSVAALTIAEAGSDALRAEVLPAVASGDRVLTWATCEDAAWASPASIQTTATADGGDFVINGVKMFVDNFTQAQQCLVACRTGGGGASGISLFLVDTGSPGIANQALVTTAKDKESEVVFNKVRVPASRLVGKLNEGWPVIEVMLDRACVLSCAQMLGAARKDAEFAFEYAKMREAFGQPIGAFQSIQHTCADMVIWIDGGELLTYEALWRMDEGLSYQVEVSQAKSFCNDKCQASARYSQIIHGGIGFMMEFDLHLWFRRIASWAMRLGTTYEHRARIAQALFDQPGAVILGRPVPAQPE